MSDTGKVNHEEIRAGAAVVVQVQANTRVMGRVVRILPDGQILVECGRDLYACKPELVTRVQNSALYRRDLFGGV